MAAFRLRVCVAQGSLTTERSHSVAKCGRPICLMSFGPLWQFLETKILELSCDAEQFHLAYFRRAPALRAAYLESRAAFCSFLSAASASTWATRSASLRAFSSVTTRACLAFSAARSASRRSAVTWFAYLARCFRFHPRSLPLGGLCIVAPRRCLYLFQLRLLRLGRRLQALRETWFFTRHVYKFLIQSSRIGG
jgi:hypothetical protein